MKEINAEFIESKNKQVLNFIKLYTIYDYDNAGTNFNMAEYDTDIIFDGITYYKFPIRLDTVSEKSGGEID